MITVWCYPADNLGAEECYLLEDIPHKLRIKQYRHVSVRRGGKSGRRLFSINPSTIHKYTSIIFLGANWNNVNSYAKTLKNLCETGVKNLERKEEEYYRIK